MRILSYLLISLLLAGVGDAAVPGWVEPGVSATYRLISGGWSDGAPVPNTGAELYITHEADQVTALGTDGTVSIYNPHTGETQIQQVTCLDGEAACLGRFWLDPAGPTGSFKDETGVSYQLAGEGPYSAAGRDWDAATMAYQNPESVVVYTVVYDVKSGLVLAYSHQYPSQKTYMVLDSINAEV